MPRKWQTKKGYVTFRELFQATWIPLCISGPILVPNGIVNQKPQTNSGSKYIRMKKSGRPKFEHQIAMEE